MNQEYVVDGAGPALVLLHGGMSNRDDFDGQLSELTARYRVWRPDRRGHGTTPVRGAPAAAVPEAIRRAYSERSPDGPEHFDHVAEKVVHLWRTEPDLPVDALRDLAVPTLLLHEQPRRLFAAEALGV